MTAGIIFEVTDENIRKAAERLKEGGLVALPTETVYGLGADATNDRAVASIFAAKGRPVFNPVIVHAPPTPPSIIPNRSGGSSACGCCSPTSACS